VSPLRRSARTAVLLLSVSAFLVSLTVPALAQEGSAPAHVRYLSVRAEETACPEGEEAPCWDLSTLIANPGDVVNVTVDFEGAAQPHDFSIKVGTETVKTPTGVGGVHHLQFTFPEASKSLDYFCSVHPKTMTGKIVIQSELGAAEELEVPHLGVNFLSYWVGVIAFMILFFVYGATFFLFKYNETPATTDQWDRPDMEGGRRFGGGVASMLALVIAAVLIGAVVWFARS
jgi:plastocyanin